MRMTRRVVLTTCACLVAGIVLAAAKTMSVQVKEAQLRDRPSFLGAVLGTLKYGDRGTVVAEQDPWIRLRSDTDGREGWVHNSALTTKKVTIRAGEDAEASASSGELALAGKGFNSSVESEFKTRNKDLDFRWIDRMEKFVVAPQTIQAFLAEGGVAPAKGGAR